MDNDSYPGVGHAAQTILVSLSEQDTFENLYRRAHTNTSKTSTSCATHIYYLDIPPWVAPVFPEKASEHTPEGYGVHVPGRR